MASGTVGKGSANDSKKSSKMKTLGQKDEKTEECTICEKVVVMEDKGIECEICKGWYHTSCVDLTEIEYEVLCSHKIGTIHWYCAECNVTITATCFWTSRQTL